MIYWSFRKPDDLTCSNRYSIPVWVPAILLLSSWIPLQSILGVVEDPIDPQSIRHVDGFKVELLRTAKSGEDSWISMCFDQRGRILLGLDKIFVNTSARLLSVSSLAIRTMPAATASLQK